MPPKKRPPSPMSDKEFQEEVERRARMAQYPAGTPQRRIPPPPTTPPMDLSEQFANVFLGGMPPQSPAVRTPPTLQAQRMAQEAIQRQALSSLAPSNPSNPLQLGGASQYALDWGVSQRRLRLPTPPSTGSSGRSGMSSISSLTDSFDSDMDIFGGFDDTPKSGGSGIRVGRLARYYKK